MSDEIGQDRIPNANLNEKIAGAAKWSILTQLISKLISPLTTVILARILTPNAFGVVASATMVISLADMTSDAGFQQYIIQHRFDNKDEMKLSANVAFWTNIFISILILIAIIINCEQLAVLVGNPGKGRALALAAFSLPLTSLSSVQTAIYQRSFNFKILFTSKVVSSLLILCTSVPLALLELDYWSIIIGTLVSNAFLAVWLTIKSDWKPKVSYSVRSLCEMLSFGMWILSESIATWLNSWSGTFVMARLMDSTYVGYYKTSTSMAGSIINVITAAVMPVVYSTLATVQDDDWRFRKYFLKLQKYLAIGVVPLAIGVLTYHKLVTMVLLGDQWLETSLFLGLWTGASCFVVVMGYMCSQAYRAIGHPEYCVIVQMAYLIPFLPALWFSAKQGYPAVTITMPLMRFVLLAINLFVMWRMVGITPYEMLSNMWTVYIAAVIAMLPGIVVTNISSSNFFSLICACLSCIIYLLELLFNNDLRKDTAELVIRTGLIKLLPSWMKKMLVKE